MALKILFALEILFAELVKINMVDCSLSLIASATDCFTDKTSQLLITVQ